MKTCIHLANINEMDLLEARKKKSHLNAWVFANKQIKIDNSSLFLKALNIQPAFHKCTSLQSWPLENIYQTKNAKKKLLILTE